MGAVQVQGRVPGKSPCSVLCSKAWRLHIHEEQRGALEEAGLSHSGPGSATAPPSGGRTWHVYYFLWPQRISNHLKIKTTYVPALWQPLKLELLKTHPVRVWQRAGENHTLLSRKPCSWQPCRAHGLPSPHWRQGSTNCLSKNEKTIPEGRQSLTQCWSLATDGWLKNSSQPFSEPITQTAKSQWLWTDLIILCNFLSWDKLTANTSDDVMCVDAHGHMLPHTRAPALTCLPWWQKYLEFPQEENGT